MKTLDLAWVKTGNIFFEELLGSDTNFAAVRSTAPRGRSEG